MDRPKTLDEVCAFAVAAIDGLQPILDEPRMRCEETLQREHIAGAPGAWLRDTVGTALDGGHGAVPGATGPNTASRSRLRSTFGG